MRGGLQHEDTGQAGEDIVKVKVLAPLVSRWSVESLV